MAIDFEELRAMVASGATAALIVDHLERKEKKRAGKRERDKLRQQSIRAADKLRDVAATMRDSERHDAMSRDVACEDQPIVVDVKSATRPSDAPPTKQTPAPNVPPHPPKDNNTPAADTGAREPKSKSPISEEAHTLAVEIERLCGIDPDFVLPGWCGAAREVQHWMNRGASAEIIKLAIERGMAKLRQKGRGPPYSPKYFENAVEDECRNAARSPQQREMFLHVVEGSGATNIQIGGYRARKGQGFAGRSRASV